jgi:dTDP-4-amino-4,6-dideoxy-D-galactose acyltransferase
MHLFKFVKDNGNILCLERQKWDSNFFSRESYNLNIDKSIITQEPNNEESLSKVLTKSFIYTKIDSNINVKVLAILYKYSFRYIDTEMILRFFNSKVTLEQGPFTIKDIQVNKNLPYKMLGSTFLYSRFHSDAHISNKKADELWILYLKNFLPTERNKMFIAYDEGQVVGVMLINISAQREATLFYVAVIPSHQRRGVGRLLINHVLFFLQTQGIGIIRTETQAKNINALNFYLRSGFRIIDKSLIVLHRWK